MDTLGDMLIRIKNGSTAGKESVSVYHSNFKHSVLKMLESEGYISSLSGKKDNGVKMIEIKLAYDENSKPKIKGLERVSKLSRRVYLNTRDIKPVKQGYGNIILSTPKGILTGSSALREKVGGEALFKIW